jgi:HEAT repeat protein
MMFPLIAAALLLAEQAHVRQQQPATAEAPQQQNLSDDEIREQIETYLGTIDTPISIARWRSLGPRAAPFLEEIAASPRALPSQRALAIDGLSAVGGDRAKGVLAQLARGEEEPLIVRLSAVRGMGRVERGNGLAVALRPVLEGAKDARVRGQAAAALAEHAAKSGCAAVKAQAQKEDEEARVHYRKALARCGEPPGAAPDKAQ